MPATAAVMFVGDSRLNFASAHLMSIVRRAAESATNIEQPVAPRCAFCRRHTASRHSPQRRRVARRSARLPRARRRSRTRRYDRHICLQPKTKSALGSQTPRLLLRAFGDVKIRATFTNERRSPHESCASAAKALIFLLCALCDRGSGRTVCNRH